jgi:hypothetical protein
MFTLPKRAVSSPLGHSAEVDLILHLKDQKVPLAQTGRTSVRLAHDVDIPAGPARVEIITDGISHFSDVTVTGRKPNSLWLNIE